MLTVVVIVFAVAMVFGPVMMLQPSKGQKRIAKTRQLANQKGLRVRLARIQDGNNSINAAIYSMPWPENTVKHCRGKLEWQLQKGQYAHDLHFAQNWEWTNSKRAPEVTYDVLRNALEKLPGNINILAANEGGLECAWNEKCFPGLDVEQSVEKMVSILSEIVSDYSQACGVK